MPRNRSVRGAVRPCVILVWLGGCAGPASGPSAANHAPDASISLGAPGATGSGSGTNGASASGSPSGVAVGATGADASAVSASTAATGGGEPLPGVCPTGFVVCHGVCLESSAIGADCSPLACAPPPAGTTPPTRAAGVTARGFDWNVATDATGTTVTFKPGKGGGSLSPTIAVDLGYRDNGGSALNATMTDPGDGTFRWQTQDFKQGDTLEFYFHQTVAPQTIINPGPGGKPLIDTMWFYQVIGKARDPEPAYPLTVKLAGRFRDRHPNEWRYDHFVDTYFAGPTFDLTLVDHGDAVDVTIAPQPSMNVTAVDFKNYECFGPTPFCYTPPALAAVGVRALKNGDVFTTRVDHLSYGQLLDFELTFVRTRTYYTEWFQYYVGSGRLQPKAQHPWARAAGDASITDVSVDQFGYAQHVPNISPAELQSFIAGKVLFEGDFESQLGYNPSTTFDCPRGQAPGSVVLPITTPPVKSPLFSAGNSFTNMTLATIARPGYTASACFSCHHLDGRGPAPDASSAAAGMGSMLLKLFSGSAASTPDPVYGTILDQRAPAGNEPEVKAALTWQTISGTFRDGTPYELRRPVVAMSALRDGPLSAATTVSTRMPRPVFGMGLLEAVPAETILARADPTDANGDGIRGRPNMVTDPLTGKQVLGRFGWKAGVASVREQAALAFVNDMGITSPLYPKHRCGTTQTSCMSSVNDATPQLSDADLDHVEAYLRHLSVPPRRNYQDPQAIMGKTLFAAIGCINCHTPNLVTSSTYPVTELRGINIQPFTDLLLHDLGDGLADAAPVEEGQASGREWRTCPLWGLGTMSAVLYPAVDAFDPNNHPPPGSYYLHDGRARSITEAILWHGGEAQGPHDAFVSMPAADRAALLAYVAYPFADPVFVRRCANGTGP